MTSGGFVTSFIDVCHCRFLKAQAESDVSPLRLCGICHKPIPGKERHGSLTQWIFRSDSCKCPEPEPVPIAEQLATSPDSESSAEDDEDEELQISASQFPHNRYKPLAILGRGAKGIVYRARDRFLKTYVAVKVLTDLSDEQIIAFHEEAKLTSRLAHLNIIKVRDFGPTEDGIPYMVMEHSLQGLTLKESLAKNGPLTPELAISVFSQICDALTYAHEMRIYHRDLKSSNLLFTLSDSGEVIVKLIDFGIACAVSEVGSTADGTMLVGTPAYMAPELAAGKSYDLRSEIYALGCLLFEALEGDVPFPSESPVESLNLHQNAQPPQLSRSPDSKLIFGLNKLIKDCLAKKPEDRPASAKVVKDRLHKSLALQGDEVSPPVVTQPLIRTKRSNVRIAIFALLALGIVVSIGLFAFQQHDEPGPDLRRKPTTKVREVFEKPGKEMANEVERKLPQEVFGHDVQFANKPLDTIMQEPVDEVTAIRIKGCRITDPYVLSETAMYPKLKVVSIENSTGLSVKAMKLLAAGLKKNASAEVRAHAKNQLEQPIALDFSDSDVTEAGLRELDGVPGILSITLAGTAVGDSVIDTFKSHKMMNAVDLSRTAITDGAIEKLSLMKSMVLIKANRCPNLKRKKSGVLDGLSIVLEPVDSDLESDFSIAFQAAQLKNANAQTRLASFYYEGNGVPRQLEEALRWYRSAAESGHAGACNSVGRFYTLGMGVKKNPREALKWYAEGARRGNKNSYMFLGQTYETGEGMEDSSEAFKWFKRAADAGLPSGQIKVATMYCTGDGVAPNYKEALLWYEKAAKQHDARAFTGLGYLNEQGYGVRQNLAKAVEYYRMAIKIGSSEAECQLGELYLNGVGVKRDYSQAMQLFLSASSKSPTGTQQGIVAANIGDMYARGLGVEQDYPKAMYWYKRAADNYNDEGILAIGDFYREGKGVQRDPALAETYYKEAAKQGNQEALHRLGLK